MSRIKKNRLYLDGRAQSTAEYVTLFAIIIGAVVAMQLFVKRASQARMKDAFTYFAGKNGLNIQGKMQYEPYYSTQNITQESSSSSAVKLGSNFVVSTSTEAESGYTSGSYEVQENSESLDASRF